VRRRLHALQEDLVCISVYRKGDRTAIVRRFFDRKGFRAIGKALGTTDDSAQKRVTRALERLRELLLKRGVALTTTLAGIFAAHWRESDPAACFCSPRRWEQWTKGADLVMLAACERVNRRTASVDPNQN